MNGLADIADFLHAEFGFDESHPGESRLRQIVSERCGLTGSLDAAEYLALLRHSAEERNALLEAVIVPETFFFRHPESFRALVSWVRERDRFPVRILSAACSTGEETYSLAMALRDAGLAPGQFVVEGCDISAASIAEARRAIYTAKAFRSESLDWRDRYFARVEDGWQAGNELLGLVRFRHGNLFALEDEGQWDVVFCRNVMIYFSPERQADVIALLSRILREDGILFLGPAEPPLFLGHGWRSAGHAMSFSCVRGGPLPVSPRRPEHKAAASRVPAPPMRRLPMVSPESPVPPAPGLESAQNFADGGRLDEAEALLSKIAESEPGNPEVHFLRGVVAEARGFDDRAEEHYRKTLYAAPDHTEALEHMALLLRRHGRLQAADHLNRRAARHNSQP